MKKHNTSSPPRLVALLFGAALLGLVSQSALAVCTSGVNCTASGTTISNLATLNYAVGGVTQTVIESAPGAGNSTAGVAAGTATTFVVDNKVNLTVAESGGTYTSVIPGATLQVTTFTVTNTGNTAQGYNLVGANATGNPTVFTVADNIDATITAVYVDSNANGVYNAGVDTATAISSLAPDTSVSVFVLATIPVAATNGQQAVVTLTATTTTDGTTTPVVATVGADTAGVDIVFADAANVISDPLAANTARDAIGIAQDAYRVASSVISVAKTATLLCDPFNGTTDPKNIPGAIVRWTVTVSNGAGAGASATLSTITDTLDANVTHDVGLRAPADAATCIAGAGTSGFKIVSTTPNTRGVGGTAGVMTNAADADGATIAGQDVTIDFSKALPAGTYNSVVYTDGEIKPNESATVTYNVIIK